MKPEQFIREYGVDKCREEFEEYFKEHHADSFYSVDVALEMRGDDYIDFLASDLWAIWQHQQAKVEELQKQLNEYIFVAETLDEMYVKEVKSSDELQKRVGALEKAEFTLARIRSIVSKNLLESILIREVRQALKGEEHKLRNALGSVQHNFDCGRNWRNSPEC